MEFVRFWSRGWRIADHDLGGFVCLVLFSFVFQGHAAEHPLKMSVAHLTHIDSNEYQIELRVFIDDLIIGTGGKLPAEPTPWSEVAPTTRKVKKYLENHLAIKINGLECELKFDHMEVEEIAVVGYLSLQGPELPSDIEAIGATNSILVDDFSNQRNIIHIELPKTARKSLLFNTHEREAQVVFAP